jgi:hypothetical protein
VGGAAPAATSSTSTAGGAAPAATSSTGASASTSGRPSSCKLDVLAWDACAVPMRPGTIDCLISDLPWGVRENT